MACTAVARSAWAVQMMTGISGSSRLISGSASIPLMRGIMRSSRMTSGRSRGICWRAAAPSSAATAWYPLLWRMAPRSDRISASSSTTRIFVTRSSRSSQLVDRDVTDGRDGARARGEEEQVQLHELVAFALEEVLHLGAHLERLSHARNAQVLTLTLHVDPRADPNVAVQRAVGLLEIEAGMSR